MDPNSQAAHEPALLTLDENRTEFSWQGQPFVFDLRSKTVSRAGRVLAKYDAIQWISISERRDEGKVISWTVTMDLGFFRSIFVGRSDNDVDASIAAARLGTVTGKKVRVL